MTPKKSKLKLNLIKSLEVSAASGLLLINGHFFLIADDDMALYIYSKDLKLINKIVLLPGELPKDEIERKKIKPDFESLVFLPNLNSILIVPSGSKPNRVSGKLINLTDLKCRTVNFKNLFAEFLKVASELNVEGCITTDSEIKFFHRGNGANQFNCIFTLDLNLFENDLLKETVNEIQLDSNINFKSAKIELGKIKDFNFCFSDAAYVEPNKIWYLAVAEAVTSTYEDGKFLAAYLGCLNDQGKIIAEHHLDILEKPEGLALDIINQKIYIVTDADDSEKKSNFYEASLP